MYPLYRSVRRIVKDFIKIFPVLPDRLPDVKSGCAFERPQPFKILNFDPDGFWGRCCRYV